MASLKSQQINNHMTQIYNFFFKKVLIFSNLRKSSIHTSSDMGLNNLTRDIITMNTRTLRSDNLLDLHISTCLSLHKKENYKRIYTVWKHIQIKKSQLNTLELFTNTYICGKYIEMWMRRMYTNYKKWWPLGGREKGKEPE